jgi:hypothetical protein
MILLVLVQARLLDLGRLQGRLVSSARIQLDWKGSNLDNSTGTEILSYTNSGDSPMLHPVLQGWRKEWKIILWQKNTIKEKPATSFKTYLKLEQAKGSIGIRMIQSHMTSVFSLDHALSVPLVQTQAKVSIEITACWPICTWAHAPIATFYIEATRRDERIYCKIE